MPHEKEHPSAGRIMGISLLLAAFICACGFAANFQTPAKQTESPQSSDSDSPGSEIIWQKVESPPFPAAWPPMAETVWVRYTFAYGINPALLADGSYVTGPLSKTEWKAGSASTTILSNELKDAGIQGVVPLDSETRIILEKEKQVSEYCLTLIALPDIDTAQTKEMLAYYNAWFKYNGVFLDLIREDHAEFIDWVLLYQ